MSEFEIGDTIVCVETEDRPGITLGRRYTALGLLPQWVTRPRVVVLNDSGLEREYPRVCFKRVSA